MSAERRLSFLLLVPNWQRPYLSDPPTQERHIRRDSVSSVGSNVSALSLLSTDYGMNGFLVLTSEPNTDIAEEDDG